MKTIEIARLYNNLKNAGLGFRELKMILNQFREFKKPVKRQYEGQSLYGLFIEDVPVVKATTDYNRLSDFVLWVADDISEMHYTDQPIINWRIEYV